MSNNNSKSKHEKRASTPKKAKSTTSVDVCSPSQTSDAAVSPDAQLQALQEQLNDVFKTGQLREYFLPSEQETVPRVIEPRSQERASSTRLAAPAKNMKENPFAPYKASGRWVTLWLYAPGGLRLGDWETNGGQLHYSSALSLHSVKVPWYMRWSAKPRLVKMIFQTGSDPYPDLNDNLHTASRSRISSICRGLIQQHTQPAVLLRAHTKDVKNRVRYWGESWPKFIKRLATKHINRRAVSSWLRKKINRWENRKSLDNQNHLRAEASSGVLVEPLEIK